MPVKLPEGAHSAQTENDHNDQPDYDQAGDEIPLSVIHRFIHGSPFYGLGSWSSSEGMAI